MKRIMKLAPAGATQRQLVFEDRHLLDVILSWRHDGYEFTDPPTDEPERVGCRVWWTIDGLECSIRIHLNVRGQQGQRHHVADPFWKALTLKVPHELSVLHPAWTPQPGFEMLVAPFEMLSRKVHYYEFEGTICLDRPVAFDRGLRNAVTHVVGRLRAKGVTW